MSKPWNKTQPSVGRNSASGSAWKHFRFGDFDFCVMVLANNRIVVGKRNWATNGAWATHDISGTVIGVSQVDDSHCDVAIAVDAAGHIHVIGNTHAINLRHIRSTAPLSITGWMTAEKPTTWLANSQTGLSFNTYNYLLRYSDGELAWIGLQYDINEAGVNDLGRDWFLWKMLPADAPTTWRPVIGLGRITNTLSVQEGNVEGTDDIPDRTYLRTAFIDEFDVLHIHVSFRMVDGSGLCLETAYLRSYDRGLNWVNINDEHVDMPVSYRKTLDGDSGSAAARIRLADNSLVGASICSNIVIDKDRNPHFVVVDSSFSSNMCHVWWDGTQWLRELTFSLGTFGVGDMPTLSRIGNDIWVWYYDYLAPDQTGTAAIGEIRGLNWSHRSTKRITLGLVTKGTPGATYSFENNAQYWPTPPHSGGLTPNGKHVTRFFMPDGDTPMVRSVGDGPQFRE